MLRKLFARATRTPAPTPTTGQHSAASAVARYHAMQAHAARMRNAAAVGMVAEAAKNDALWAGRR